MLDRRPANSTREARRESSGTQAARRVTRGERDSNESGAGSRRNKEVSRMAVTKRNRLLEPLLERSEWAAARKLIQRELKKQPENHWLLTQLGVTYYEEGKYREALPIFLSSVRIVPDCPLILWNVAGTLDALGRPEDAIPIYTSLLRSTKTAADDPCWESKEWSDNLKTDCVYRLGVCFLHMKRRESAEHCFRQYVNLLLAGMNGTYPIEEAATQIREVHRNGKVQADEVRKAFKTTLLDEGIHTIESRFRGLPPLSLPTLVTSP
jgi:hypothetical protein